MMINNDKAIKGVLTVEKKHKRTDELFFAIACILLMSLYGQQEYQKKILIEDIKKTSPAKTAIFQNDIKKMTSPRFLN